MASAPEQEVDTARTRKGYSAQTVSLRSLNSKYVQPEREVHAAWKISIRSLNNAWKVEDQRRKPRGGGYGAVAGVGKNEKRGRGRAWRRDAQTYGSNDS